MNKIDEWSTDISGDWWDWWATVDADETANFNVARRGDLFIISLFGEEEVYQLRFRINGTLRNLDEIKDKNK